MKRTQAIEGWDMTLSVSAVTNLARSYRLNNPQASWWEIGEYLKRCGLVCLTDEVNKEVMNGSKYR